ncbi:FecR domain-containing protein [Halobacteriovorax sp. YZS-1-1]|uniref:FecR domain-containing protein n=1 Tax=unclassified Halobacteriovorax TaxID=2639665 RepID=UPI00399C3316
MRKEYQYGKRIVGRVNSLLDTFVILVCICVAAFAGNQVFNTSYYPPIIGGERITLGQVFELRNDVRRRSFDNFSWHDLGSNEALYHNDRIFTDKDSTAELEFSSGNRLKVSEESLFKITQDTDGINLNIEQGVVFATLSNSSEAFVVKVGDQIYEIKSDSSKIKISTDGKNKELSVLEGQAKVRLGNREETIEKGVRVLLTNDSYTVKKSWPSEFAPTDGKLFYLVENNQVKFNFNEDVEKLHLSKTKSAFENGEVFDVTNNQIAIKDLGQGIYYWQVSNDKEVSTEKSFEIIFEEIPTFENLENESRLLVGQEKTIYTQSFDSIDFFINDEIIEDVDYDDGVLKVNFDEVGSYKLSYRNKSIEHPFALKSKSHLIEVIKAPEKIVLKRPFNGEEYYFYQKDLVEFNWETADLPEGLETYLVLNGKRHLVAGQSYKIPIEESGDYEWSLEYYFNGEKVSASDENEFSVTFDNDNSALENGRKVVVKKPGDMIDLTWANKAAPGERSFQVEISKDRSFKNIVQEIETTEANTKLLIKELGVHYWRVKNESGKFVPPVKIIIVPPPPPPAPKIKKIEKRVEMNQLGPFVGRVLNWFIPVAHAKDDIVLKWEAVNDVKEYRVQILDGDDIVVDEKVKINRYEWKDYSVGHFQWRVSAIDYWNQESEFSSKEDLIVTKKFGGAQGINLLSPRHGKRFKKDDVIELQFEQVRGDRFYIEFSKDRFFRNIKEVSLGKATSYRFKNQLEESFYWRVKAIEKGDVIYSKKRRIDIKKEIKENRISKSKPKLEKSERDTHWFLGFSPELLTYDIISNSKKLEVDDMNLISIIGGYKTKIKDYDAKFSLKHSSGVVFEDLAFNRTRLGAQVLSPLNSVAGLKYGVVTQVEYRNELSVLSDNSIESNAEFYLNLAPSLNYKIGKVSAELNYFILNYSGLNFEVSYEISDMYQASFSYEDFSNSDIESNQQSMAFNLQYNF